MKKKTVSPINTDITNRLPKEIKMKHKNESSKILGICFNENMQYANNLNWEITVDKMEKHTNRLSRRILSLNGKAIIANTLILSKTPQAHSIAMRIKHLLQLKQKNNTPLWKNIATYWLAVDLYKYSKDYHFLMDNNRIKTTNDLKPYYYKDIIYYIKYENKEIQKLQNPNTKNIY